MKSRRLLPLTLGAAGAVLLWRLRPDSGSRGPAQPTALTREPRLVTRLAAWEPAAPSSALGRWVAYLSAAPVTVGGLLLGALSGRVPVVRDGVLVFANARGLAGRMLRWRGFTAATLGHAIIAATEPSPALLRHELTHARQAERFGPLFAPLYLAGLIIYGYRHNPFERAAYLAAERHPPTV
jgi:hypothetical protein